MGGKKGDETKIFVGGLSQQTTTDGLRRHFEQYGSISDCIVMSDPASGRSRGFGFVTYDSAEAVDKLLSMKQTLDGKEVDCKRACPRESLNSSRGPNVNSGRTDKIFVGGLPDITTEEFKEYFEKYGKIVDAVLMQDKGSGRPRGFGFITFNTPDAVDEVVRKYNDHSIKGKWVEVKRAHPKEQSNNRDGRMGNQFFPGGNFDSYNRQVYGDDRRGGQLYGPQGASPYGPQGGAYVDPYAQQRAGYGQQANPRGAYADPYNMRNSPQGYSDPYSQAPANAYAPNGGSYGAQPAAYAYDKTYGAAYGGAAVAVGYANGSTAVGSQSAGYSQTPAAAAATVAADPYNAFSLYSQQFGPQRAANRATGNRAYPY